MARGRTGSIVTMDTLESLTENAQWNPTPYQLQDLKDMKLPIVVKLADSGVDLGPDVDTDAAFLLYSRRRRTKVYAECMGMEEGKKTMLPYGPVYEIPKDFTGWFEVFLPDGSQPKPYTSLDKLLECKQFLVRTTLHVFHCEEGNINLEEEIKIYPGEVLTVKGVIKKQWKVNTSTSSLPETSFLRCSDFKNRDICFPLAHPGYFNPIYDPELTKSNPTNAVYQIADLVDSQFPVIVRLAFGWPPQGGSFRSFTGVMQLVGLRRPDTMVLCNIIPGKTVLLEVPLDMNLSLLTADNMEALQTNYAYKHLVKQCYEKVYQFVISIRAMDIKYAVLEPHNGRTHKKFAVPIDMDQFNPLEVFPPLDKDEQPGQSFQLSFKDPEADFETRASNTLEGYRDVEEAQSEAQVTTEMMGGPRTTELVRSNLHNMREQYIRRREFRESIA